MKLVHGRLGYMGWLHTGRKKGETGYYGQEGQFSSQIFERSQKPTWHGGQRLPIHRLFGPAIVDMISTSDFQVFLSSSKNWASILNTLDRNYAP